MIALPSAAAGAAETGDLPHPGCGGKTGAHAGNAIGRKMAKLWHNRLHFTPFRDYLMARIRQAVIPTAIYFFLIP